MIPIYIDTEKYTGCGECELIGTIPYDEKITEAQINGLSVVEYTQAPITKIIKRVWDQVKYLAF